MGQKKRKMKERKKNDEKRINCGFKKYCQSACSIKYLAFKFSYFYKLILYIELFS